MHRLTSVVALLLVVAGATPASAGLATTGGQAAPAPAAANVQADFNNDGFADLAVGAPGEDAGSVVDAGAVNVLYGGGGRLSGAGSQLFTQVGSAAEPGDFFGAAMAAGDFNGDGYADLAVGAPFEDGVGTVDVGAVSVLYGSAGGLGTAGGRLFTQVGSATEPGDLFGYALSAGDFNNDGAADLAAGAPLEDASSIVDAGAVSVLYGSAGGLGTAGGRLFTQVGSAAEPGDWFGYALSAGDFNNDGAADLAAGAPFEDASSIVDAGAVSVLYGSAGGLGTAGGRLFTQVGSAAERGDGFGARVAAGDFNNDGYADLAVGAPYEYAGTIPIAGAVSVLYGSAGGLGTAGGRLFTQIGAVEGYDQFGDALATGDFNNDGFTDLAAGAPVEDVNNIGDAGAVSVLFGSAAGITATGAYTFTQVGSAAEAGDYFGWALATGDFDNDGFADLAVGAEGEDVYSAIDAGAVSVLYGSSAGVTTAAGQIFTQDTPGVGSSAEPGDFFGLSLAAGAAEPAALSVGASSSDQRSSRVDRTAQHR